MNTGKGSLLPMMALATAGMLLSGGQVFAVADIYAVQSRISMPNFQSFNQINADSMIGDSGPLYSPAGGVYAAAFLGGIFCGIELENGTFFDYLVTIPHVGDASGSRVLSITHKSGRWLEF